MHRRLSILAIILPAAIALAASGAIAAGETDAAAEAGATSQAEIPAAQIPKAITDAVNSPDRPAADKQLDAGRHPEQILAFFGIAPGMKVADLWAGGGYTTELLARTVGPSGKVYSQNGPFPPRFKKGEDAWKARLKEPGMSNVVELEKPFAHPDDILPVPLESLDAVIINMNYHDLVGRGYDRGRINAAVFKALKPGGVYGVIDNSAAPGSGARDANTLHRIDEAFEVNEIKHAGFKLDAVSSVLRNPKDDRTWFIMKHRGEQDRFVLKFIKPPGAGGIGGGLSH
ncbi:MAG: class I SAM-dependent methyltransferase [Candidatus Binataceae bacterium]